MVRLPRVLGNSATGTCFAIFLNTVVVFSVAWISLSRCNAKDEDKDVLQTRLTIPVTVTRVIDGDTVVCELKYTVKVRLLDCWAAERGTIDGDRATYHLKRFAEGRSGILIVPVYNGRLSKSLSLDRALGYVRIAPMTIAPGRSQGMIDLSEWMVKNGYASKQKPKAK